MLRRSRLIMVILPAVAFIALGLGVSSLVRSNAKAPEPQFAAPAGKAPRALVAGLGIVEPAGREIAIATFTPGVVARVLVRPGDTVSAGTPLFAIDDRIAAATVEARKRDLEAARARLALTIAKVPQIRADVAVARGAIQTAEAERDDAQDQFDTGSQLTGAAIAQRELARRRNALRAAEGRLSEARARLAAAEVGLAINDPAQSGAAVEVERAAVEQAEAGLALAETDRDRLVVRSPIDGTVLVVNVRPGEFAAAGADSSPIVLGRPKPLHVRVDIDEADLPRLQLSAWAVASRRGAINERIPLRPLRAEPIVAPKRSLGGGAAERVDTRVLQVIYAVEDEKADLRPGQLLDVLIGSPVETSSIKQ
jgi:HlyD family secretion protein